MSESKGLSLVNLNPAHEITFTGPYTDVVTSYLKIQNTHSKNICFKVKTTAPKQYCVRPNSGIVKPGETATVAVMLQPVDAIPADAAKHKFMVQSCYAPPDGTDLETFWKSVNPAELHYGKLRVVFEPGSTVKNVTGSTAAPLSTTSMTTTTARPPVGGPAGDADSPTVLHASSSPASSIYSSVPSGPEDRTRRLEAEVERLTRERAELLLKVQAANAKAAQAGDFPVPMVQMLLIVIAGLLFGLIIGRLI